MNSVLSSDWISADAVETFYMQSIDKIPSSPFLSLLWKNSLSAFLLADVHELCVLQKPHNLLTADIK